MTEHRISTTRQREIVAEVARVVKHRAERQAELKTTLSSKTKACSERFDAQRDRLQNAFNVQAKALDVEYVAGLEKARRRYENGLDEIRHECNTNTNQLQSELQQAISDAELAWRQTRALTIDEFASERTTAKEFGEQTRTTLAGYHEQLAWLEKEAQRMLRRRGVRPSNPPPSRMRVEETTAELVRHYSESASLAHGKLQEIASWRATRFVDEGWAVLLFFVTLIASIYPAGAVWGWQSWHWLAISGGFATGVAVIARQLAQWLVRRRSQTKLVELQSVVADARQSVSRADKTIEREHASRLQRIDEREKQQLQQADETWELVSGELKRESQEKALAISSHLLATEKELEQQWESNARPFREEFPPRIESHRQQFESDLAELEQARQQELAEFQAEFDTQWAELVESYTASMTAATDEMNRMREYCDNITSDFSAVDWNQWQPATTAPLAVRWGEYLVDLAQLEGGLTDEEGLKIEQTTWQVPATLSFPELPSLLVEATDQGRDEAIRLMRNCMLQMLTLFPAGKLRFTIIDPTGLGQNFSEFMHLADFDERLVTSRIWTESSHINQRLLDVTEHMENVIQKYLRNEFGSIQEYNEKAGEVAEPFQVLVVANFPANFSEETARRLVSIAASGARCGVYTLILADSKMALPRNFDLADLAAQANNIVWRDGSFHWQHDELAEFPLQWDLPVDGDTLTDAMRAAGENAKDANRVEVPFDAVVPPQNEWWTHDSRDGISVPLGRAGATKLQYMKLGSGTSQHVLISGKTGSGKSTLMHAMITNLAIHYSPQELQFFLVDFKKGVEFKTYAQFRLPHAQVIAIESEREFGMSVLERLDEELKRRGDIFRDVGVQGLAGFREARPDQSMPRQMLIVDEFQEFFVKDDKLAQDASLLLDRLIRQGRAFGIHVLLGSQTLAGAYSLARSTLGQMAVRIALQCSESDAHLILSEDNTAARLLSRPGEAIYNNANGLFEGNHPFQAVWLPDSQREQYLRDIELLVQTHRVETKPAIVFEGNIPADPATNVSLCGALSSVPSPVRRSAPIAWLGAAIAIKEPTHVVLRRQSGGNILITGQQEELAAGVMANALISLAANQLPKSTPAGSREARMLILDGGGFEAEDIQLGSRMQKRLPLEIDNVAAVDVDDQIQQLAAEVTSRTETKEERPPIYVAIYNLARFRSLRRDDDDYGLGSFTDDDVAMTAAQSLAHLLREGPPVGVHVLMWCDTYNNVTRWLDRQNMRDISHRVLFQMSATDSSNLMDSAAASQLGAIRAIYYSDELGEFERFRPYGSPSNDWFDRAASLLTGCDSDPANTAAPADDDGNVNH